jgi:hypothetical protein
MVRASWACWPLKCLDQLRNLDPHLALGRLREHPRISLPLDHASSMARAETLVRLAATEEA